MTTTIAKADAGLPAQIRKMEQAFQLAMPRGVEAKQLIRDALTCLQTNPKLAQCEQKSLLGALMTCAQLGLRPGVGALGQAYLLPFWDKKSGGQKAQLVIGYQGYVELAHRSGRIASIHARTVYSNDEFHIEYGAAEDKWVHRPCISGPRGEPVLFYAVGRTIDGGYSITDPMTVADMESYRDKHATARTREGKVFGPWVDHFEAMAHKTMVRKLMKLLPKSTEVARAMTQDDGVRLDVSPDAINQTPDYIDGEVADDESASGVEAGPAPASEPEPTPAKSSRSKPKPEAVEVEILMATPDQVAQLVQIRAQERYDSDEDWSGYLHDVFGYTTADLTQEQAAQVISAFNEEASK